VEFRLPEQSLPPPRPGETVKEPFPSTSSSHAVAVEAGPLESFALPRGRDSPGPFVSVTFNQPMCRWERSRTGGGRCAGSVELPARHLEVAGHQDPELRVQLGGDRPLPMATEYVVTVPAGTRSATGGVLARR